MAPSLFSMGPTAASFLEASIRWATFLGPQSRIACCWLMPMSTMTAGAFLQRCRRVHQVIAANHGELPCKKHWEA